MSAEATTGDLYYEDAPRLPESLVPAIPVNPGQLILHTLMKQNARLRARNTILEDRNIIQGDIIRGQQETIQEQTETIGYLHEANQELHHESRHDPLTKLLTRNALTDELETRLAEERPERVALLFLDVDKFKPINDRFGHAMGDLVLKRIARFLQENTRHKGADHDAIHGRYGGDEFLVLVTAEQALALKLAGRLLERFDGVTNWTGFGDIDNQINSNPEQRLGLSVGVVMGNECTTATEMVAEADRRMYEMKHGSRQDPEREDRNEG